MFTKYFNLKGLLFIGLLSTSFSSVAQTGISLYHLGDRTIQISQYNPALQAQGNFNLALPLISKIDFNVNNAFSFHDVFKKVSNGNYHLSKENLFDRVANNGQLRVDLNKLTLFQAGFTLPKSNLGFTLFSNLNSNTSFSYSKEFFQIILGGTAETIGSGLTIDDMEASSMSYVEAGVGVQKSFLQKQLKVGLNLKYLMGAGYLQSNRQLSAKVTTDKDNYNLNMDLKNFGYQYSFPDEDFKPFKNTGMAVDLGAYYAISDQWNVSVAANDIGSILWKDVNNESIKDQVITFSGIDLSSDDSGIPDTLADKFNSISGPKSNVKTNLPVRLLVAGQYALTPKDVFSASSVTVLSEGSSRKYFGLGYTRKFNRNIEVTVNGVNLPNQAIALGFGTALNAGPVQFYLATDNLLAMNVSRARGADLKLGLNLTFSRGGRKKKEMNPANNPESAVK